MKAILNNEMEVVIVMNRREVASISRALYDSQAYNMREGYKFISKNDEELAMQLLKIYKDAFDK